MVGLLLILMAIAGFLLFLVGTASGAALLLRIGLSLAGSGEARGVQGSLYQGLSIAELRYEGNGLGVVADGIRLEVDWPALQQRRLRVIEASVASLELDLPAAEPSTEPFQMPAVPEWPELPVRVAVDRLALGSLVVRRGGEPLPMALGPVALRATAEPERAVVELLELELESGEAGVSAHGELTLAPAATPEQTPSLDLQLALQVRQGKQASVANLKAQGTLDHIRLDAEATGYELEAALRAELSPFSEVLPLSSLTGSVRGLRPELWVPDMPPARLDLSVALDLEGELWPAGQIGALDPDRIRSRIAVTVEPDSRWQGRPLSGEIRLRQEGWLLPEAKVALRVGDNRVEADGALGAANDVLRYRLQVPAPAQLWPGLEGRADLAGELRGLPERHGLTLKGTLEPPPGLLPAAAAASTTPAVQIEGGEIVVNDPTPLEAALDIPAILAEGPYRIDVAVEGSWGPGGPQAWQPGRLGWRGRVARLSLGNPKVSLGVPAPATVDVVMAVGDAPLGWRVGTTRLQLDLPGKRRVVLSLQETSGAGANWRSVGRMDDLVPAWVVAQLPRSQQPLSLDLAWSLDKSAALTGEVTLRRRSGDIIIPGDQDISLGLQNLQLRLVATAAGGGASNLNFNLDVAGTRLGRLSATGNTRVVLVNGVPLVTEQEPIRVDANLALDDLSWLMAFTGDATELGGKVAGDVRLERVAGQWQANGTINGDGLRVVRVDDGVRMLNGTLRARFTHDRLDIDSLRFPSEIRTVPSNSAVRAWVAQYGKQGVVEASGSWSLTDASGEARVSISNYPLVQRVDRFVAGSGEVRIQAAPRRFDISGKVTVDIGWVNIEGTDELPSLASDVVIVQPGQKAPEAEAPAALPMRLNLEVDLGQRMMLTGMGLNTGLTGAITIRNSPGGLRGTGVVNTRDGRFSIYGQTLVVRQGAITFQGLLDDPLLAIVAVRPNLAVEAGVQIGGTARQPEINLVSFPDVPETEKLSWLLLGRGPDSRGADAGLLLSAAASLFGNGDGDPLYRRFGLDELGLRSGMGSSVQGVLPDRTVVGSLTSSSTSASDGGQFLVVGKRLSDALYVTFEQALSGGDAVVRASYRVSERLSLSVQGGTINGLQLVWSLFW